MANWFSGNWFGGSSSGGGATTFPVLSQATTKASIRDRIHTLIEALAPDSLERDKFRRYRNEGGARFMEWCEANAAGAWRRFQVREVGADEDPDTTNTDGEYRFVSFRLLVAYPQNQRSGRDGALDRDDVVEQDWFAINQAIGLNGRSNFTAPNPDAAPIVCRKEEQLIERDGVDFLDVELRYYYVRQRA